MAVCGCFYRRMHALSDEEQMNRLESKVDRMETKIDSGLATVRSESRADFRLLLGVQLSMFVAMILGFAGIIFQHLG
jgi:hypothetical protein